jgi:hypothetical protein
VLGHEGTAGNETADLLARTGPEHPFTGPESASGISIGISKKAVRDWTKSQKHWESTAGLKQARIFCQKKEESIEVKQRLIKMGGRTIYRILSPKNTPFQTGIDR